MNRRFRSFLSSIVLISFTSFIALVFLEIIVRYFHLSKTASSYNNKKVAKFNTFFSIKNCYGIPIYEQLEKNSRNLLDSIVYQANSMGFRDDEFEIGAKNILFFGSSVTFGYDSQAENRFVSLFEQQLYKDYKINVYDFSMPGTLLDQHVENLKEYINIYDPSFVILQFSPGNFTFFDKEKSLSTGDDSFVIITKNKPFIEKIKILLRKSNLYLFLAERYNYFRIILGLELEQRYLVDSKMKDFTFKRLNAFISCCETNNVPVYLFFIPDDYIVYRKRIIDKKKDVHILIKEFCLKNNIPLIDPTNHLREYYNQDLFLDDCHLTPFGHKLVSDYIIKYFKENPLNLAINK